MAKKKVKLRRLFVDPASVSSGWALFEDDDFVESGTVLADKKQKIWDRLKYVYNAYKELPFEFDEVHVEDVPRVRTCHIYVHYSVGIVLAALANKADVLKVDIPVKAWQKHVEWEEKEKPLKAFKRRAESRDELAAIGMGLWYLSEED